MEQVISFLDNCRLGKKQISGRLTVFPLLGVREDKPFYLTLEEAFAAQTLEVTEKGHEGHVPEVMVINTGDVPVLIVDGEELEGAKQNRTVNATFLIAARVTVMVPVSCVEQGRWRYKSRAFQYSGRMVHASLRREKQRHVSANLSHGDGYKSNQGAVWSRIAETSSELSVDSETMAMADVFEAYKSDLETTAKAFTLVDGQVGAVIAIDGVIVGLEAFESGQTFSRFFGKTVQSYAVDAMGLERQGLKSTSSPSPTDARRFIASIGKGKGENHPSISRGTTVTFSSRAVSGAALVEGDHLLHLSAFKKA
ncbi:MAG: DUF6569 family protein [Pseudomonadota bacterium]